jgi:hypothetical protein
MAYGLHEVVGRVVRVVIRAPQALHLLHGICSRERSPHISCARRRGKNEKTKSIKVIFSLFQGSGNCAELKFHFSLCKSLAILFKLVPENFILHTKVA